MDTGRWTVIRQEQPAKRRASEPHNRRRVLARCVCGYEKSVWLDDIVQGRSTGCDSHRCRARYEVSCELQDQLRVWMRESGRRDLIQLREDLAQAE